MFDREPAGMSDCELRVLAANQRAEMARLRGDVHATAERGRNVAAVLGAAGLVVGFVIGAAAGFGIGRFSR